MKSRLRTILYDDMEIAGLNTLNPSSAVDMIIPGIWGWKWISLTLVWPWWMNKSCAGNSTIEGPIVRGSSSASTDKSHTVTWLSRLDKQITDSSCGAHSIDDMAPLWYLKWANGVLLSRMARKSHTYIMSQHKIQNKN